MAARERIRKRSMRFMASIFGDLRYLLIILPRWY